MERVVVIGAGQAGVQVTDSLRAGGYTGGLVLVGEETQLPYQRPPLSKDYLAADGSAEPLPLRADRFFADNAIDFRAGTTAVAVDRRSRTVLLADGSVLPYDRLVLATGAANRTLPGPDVEGVFGLRTLPEAEALRAELARARSVVVVGAGFIGLELAAAARKRGLGVTVLEAAERPLGRAVSAAMSEYLLGAHRRMGTGVRLGEGVAGLRSDGGRVRAVVSTTGDVYPADVVLVGIGVHPRTELAEAAGLEVAGGIVVDAELRTSDPAIYAVGDCAAFPSPHTGSRVRLESVQNATDQARHLARVLLGEAEPYTAVPWFWSNQGPVRLQIAGLSRPDDELVVCGDVEAGKFSVLCFRDGALAAVESVNKPSDHMAARRLLTVGCDLAPEAIGLDFDLKTYARAAV